MCDYMSVGVWCVCVSVYVLCMCVWCVNVCECVCVWCLNVCLCECVLCLCVVSVPCVSVCSGVAGPQSWRWHSVVLGGWLPSRPAGGGRHVPEVTCFCFWEGAGRGGGPEGGSLDCG